MQQPGVGKLNGPAHLHVIANSASPCACRAEDDDAVTTIATFDNHGGEHISLTGHSNKGMNASTERAVVATIVVVKFIATTEVCFGKIEAQPLRSLPLALLHWCSALFGAC